MPYELVESSTGNLVGYYDTERAALQDVLAAIEEHGERAAETLVLGFDDPQGAGAEIARGEALTRRARASTKSAGPDGRANGELVAKAHTTGRRPTGG
jgi:hypothetical protein